MSQIQAASNFQFVNPLAGVFIVLLQCIVIAEGFRLLEQKDESENMVVNRIILCFFG